MVFKTDKQELSRDALLGIIACIIGVAGVVFELGWISRILLVAAAVALTIYAARRHSAHLALRTVVAILVAATLVAFSARPIWEDFHKKYQRIVFRWPISFSGPDESSTPRSEPPDLPPLDLPGPPLSKWGKILYICPLPPKVDPDDRAAAKVAMRRNADVYGNALGVSFVFNDIPYGVRFDMTANSAEGEARMAGVQRVTIQLETASQGVFVTVLMNLPGGMGILESVGVDRNSEIEKLWTKQVERIVAAPEGKCRLL
jgi:hypothetical protein